MKRTLFALMMLLAGSTAWGQPIGNPTINYQGRAQNSDGSPVTGQHQVVLTIYDAATAGTSLFTETHSAVNFSDAGNFTVVIGETTPGGIPASVGFNQPRWLGVRISGFNGGNEIPRLRFHGSPYSTIANRADSARNAGTAVRAGQADRAVFADSSRASHSADLAAEATHAASATVAESAGDLRLPITLTNNDPTAATLTVKNPAKDGTAIGVDGDVQVRGDITATGVCGTTDHFLVGRDLGDGGVATPGALYRDNVPLAWGQILPDGTILADFGIKQVIHSPSNPGIYTVVLDNNVTIDAANRPGFAVVVTPTMESTLGSPLIVAGWNYANDQSSNLPRTDAFTVITRTVDTGQDTRFSVVVFGRAAQ